MSWASSPDVLSPSPPANATTAPGPAASQSHGLAAGVGAGGGEGLFHDSPPTGQAYWEPMVRYRWFHQRPGKPEVGAGCCLTASSVSAAGGHYFSGWAHLGRVASSGCEPPCAERKRPGPVRAEARPRVGKVAVVGRRQTRAKPVSRWWGLRRSRFGALGGADGTWVHATFCSPVFSQGLEAPASGRMKRGTGSLPGRP